MRACFLIDMPTLKEGDVVDIGEIREDVHHWSGLEPDQQVLVHNSRLVRGIGSLTLEGPEPPEIKIYGHPATRETISVRTYFGWQAVRTTYYGDAHVSDLKRFLARRYQLSPSRQVLTSLWVTIADEDTLGSYAAADPIEVAVSVEEEAKPAKTVVVSVMRRDGRGSRVFPMHAEDTFDVQLGKMEDAGMVAQGEEVTFLSGNTLFENWRTFSYYELTTVMLRIHE